MMEPPLLEIRALDLDMGSGTLCRGLDLVIETGSRWGILGPNGAGKSTLLHTLAGLLPIVHGEILFRGKPLQHLPRKELARQLGVLFQMEESHFPGTLFEVVLSGRHPHLGRFGWEGAEDLEIAHEAIRALGLEALEARDPATLSGGERQRMEIATLLAQQPLLALLDEPTNHLDPGQQVDMLRLLREHFSGPSRGMIMVLHDINQALRFCDRLLLLRGDGHWMAGQAGEVATTENLGWLYGRKAVEIVYRNGRCFVFG